MQPGKQAICNRRYHRLFFSFRSTSAFLMRRPFNTITILFPVILGAGRLVTCAGILMYVWYCNFAFFVRSLIERFSFMSSFGSTETKSEC